MRFMLLRILVLFSPAPIAAQAPPITTGTRVRVETQQRTRVDGTLVSQSGDSIIVATPSAVRTAVASGAVRRIDVSNGRSHGQGALKGMKVGAVASGGAVGLVLGAAYIGNRVENNSFFPLYAYALWAAAIGAVSGAAIGGIVGADRWSTVYSAPIQVNFRPFPGAPAVGVSIRF